MTFRTIHQMWKDHDVPVECRSYMNSWKLHHPEWKYCFWTDEDILKLITKHYGWFLQTYNNYKHNIQRADAARHVILHHHGGLYCDIDIECYKPTDKLFDDVCVVFGENPDDFDNILTNSIYYAPKGCKFMMRCIKTLNIQRDLKQHAYECDGGYVLRTTGCVFIDSMYHRWKHALSVERETHERFERRLKNERMNIPDDYTPEPVEYGVHHSMGSWC